MYVMNPLQVVTLSSDAADAQPSRERVKIFFYNINFLYAMMFVLMRFEGGVVG